MPRVYSHCDVRVQGLRGLPLYPVSAVTKLQLLACLEELGVGDASDTVFHLLLCYTAGPPPHAELRDQKHQWLLGLSEIFVSLENLDRI